MFFLRSCYLFVAVFATCPLFSLHLADHPRVHDDQKKVIRPYTSLHDKSLQSKSLQSSPQKLQEDIIKRYQEELQKHDFKLTRSLVKQAPYYKISKTMLRELAKKTQFTELEAAVDFAKECKTYYPGVPVKSYDLISSALFIEELKLKANKKQFFSIDETKLTHDIEYDLTTGDYYIHLSSDQNGIIGRGLYKVVTKAFMYRPKPELLACLRQNSANDKELYILKKIEGRPGVVQVLSTTFYKLPKKNVYSMYCKLYNKGELTNCFRNKDNVLSFKEKISVAVDLLTGLQEIQSQGIIHKDLCPQNCLLDISTIQGERKVSAVISDFGCAIELDEAQGVWVQGHTEYTPPEGIYMERMRGKDYFQADLFAMGNILYELYYNKAPSWFSIWHVKGSGTPEARYNNYVKQIEKELLPKYIELQRKKTEQVPLSLEEEFEYLVFQMCHPNPDMRHTAEYHVKEFSALFERANSLPNTSL